MKPMIAIGNDNTRWCHPARSESENTVEDGAESFMVLRDIGKKSATFVAFLATAFAGACDDFPSEPALRIAVEPTTTWPSSMAVTDTVELQVRVSDPKGTVFTGLELEWLSSDANLLEVSKQAPPDSIALPDGGFRSAEREDSLEAQLKGILIARDTGSAEVVVKASQRGLEPAELRFPITTVLLAVEQVLALPEAIAATDTAIVELAIKDSDDSLLVGRAIEWRSTNESVLTVVKLDATRAKVTGIARGSAQVVASIGKEGFRLTEFRQSITVLERWIHVSAGFRHTCGITINNDLYCWGSGFIGNGSSTGSRIPVQVLGGLKFGSVTASDGHTCGTLVDGTVYCWGRNRFGAIGNSLPFDQLTPVPVSLGRTFSSVVAGRGYVCGATTDEPSLGFCWGNNSGWQLGDAGLEGFTPVPQFDDCGIASPNRCSLTPRPVQDRNFNPLTLLAIGLGESHTCAILASGETVCWGSGSVELGSSTSVTTDSTVADPVVHVPTSVRFRSISAGESHTCAITAAQGEAYCWGLNSHGQLAIETADSTCISMGQSFSCSSTPLPVGLQLVDFDAGQRSTCGITSDSTASYCWGSNEFGQLSIPLAPQTCEARVSCSWAPVSIRIPGDPKIIAISVGQRHACAVTADGAAYCWGEAAGGKLGNDEIADTATMVAPTRISEPG